MNDNDIKLLRKLARKLDRLNLFRRIDQKKGESPANPVKRLFCKRCFGAVASEVLGTAETTSERNEEKYGYVNGVYALRDILMRGKHFKQFGGKKASLQLYLEIYCGAPPYCFSHEEWPKYNKGLIVKSMGDVIRRAIELNKE